MAAASTYRRLAGTAPATAGALTRPQGTDPATVGARTIPPQGTDPATVGARTIPRPSARGLSPSPLAHAHHKLAAALLLLLPLPPHLHATEVTKAEANNTTTGDPQKGRAIVASRQLGLCLLCHTAPIPEERFQGNLAPDLAGAGSRHTIAALRDRIMDSSRINPATIMPSYFRTEGLARVAPAHQGKTILTAQQVEDVVAYLATLKEPP
jgi:sulfur-oxidizing protein SoxX